MIRTRNDLGFMKLPEAVKVAARWDVTDAGDDAEAMRVLKLTAHERGRAHPLMKALARAAIAVMEEHKRAVARPANRLLTAEEHKARIHDGLTARMKGTLLREMVDTPHGIIKIDGKSKIRLRAGLELVEEGRAVTIRDEEKYVQRGRTDASPGKRRTLVIARVMNRDGDEGRI